MRKEILFFIFLFFLTSCSYNPFSNNNHTTGSPTAAVIGGGIGAGTIAWLGGSKPLMVFGGITGGMLGYYMTTLRYDAGGIIKAGGQVYKIGDFVGIYIQSDNLFIPNTAELLPQAGRILDSAVTVLRRYPNNNIIISGSTSGFSRRRWELRLSERRAQVIANYLWNAGINSFRGIDTDSRCLRYVGYGDYFPIAQKYTNSGIRSNSRIQITSYPTNIDLLTDPKHAAMNNMGATDDSEVVNRALIESCFNGTGKCPVEDP